MTYSWESKCLEGSTSSRSYTGPHCFKSKCSASANSIEITVGTSIGTCNTPGSTVTIGGTSINCPSDFNSFCGRIPC